MKGSKKIMDKKGSNIGADDFIGMNNPEEHKFDEDMASIGELERLREENKRLKKTLVEKFQEDNSI